VPRKELVELELSQIDLGERYVRYWGKGSKERIVPLTEATCRAIEAYLAVRKPKDKNCHRVFLNSCGLPLSGGSVGGVLAKICHRAGLGDKGITLHKLRHTCFTLLLKAGVDLVTIKEIAGHEDISTTRIYTHVTQNEVRAAMEKHPFK
jgi:site-specific recombinase XerD